MEHLYSIMNLDTSHLDEICEDIKYQVKNGVASCALFKMTLVPEGTPPADKAAVYCAQYRKFKEKLDAENIPNGTAINSEINVIIKVLIIAGIIDWLSEVYSQAKMSALI